MLACSQAGDLADLRRLDQHQDRGRASNIEEPRTHRADPSRPWNRRAGDSRISPPRIGPSSSPTSANAICDQIFRLSQLAAGIRWKCVTLP